MSTRISAAFWSAGSRSSAARTVRRRSSTTARSAGSAASEVEVTREPRAPMSSRSSGGGLLMFGVIPAAGAGSRIQPLAFSKELLPVGSRLEAGVERPRAVSEYLVERMIKAGARHICFVVSPGKSDILEYYGGQIGPADVCYTVQPRPA